jgi:hypothetical protein
MRAKFFGLLMFYFFCSVTFAQAPSPKAQRCLTASMAVEDIAKALSKSKVAEAKNIVVNSALPPAQTRKLDGLITLWSRQDPKVFTPQFGQQSSQQYYLDCMANK